MAIRERELSDAIKSLRTTLGESQQQFSNRLGVAVSTVARYEGKAPPHGPMLVRLAEIAGACSRHDLVSIFQKAYVAGVAEKLTPMSVAIRNFRVILGDTQQEFARRVGLSNISIARYETNTPPGPRALEKLAVSAEQHGLKELAVQFAPGAQGGQLKTEHEARMQEREAMVQMLLDRVESLGQRDFFKARAALAILDAPDENIPEELFYALKETFDQVDRVFTQIVIAIRRKSNPEKNVDDASIEEEAKRAATFFWTRDWQPTPAVPQNEQLRFLGDLAQMLAEHLEWYLTRNAKQDADIVRGAKFMRGFAAKLLEKADDKDPA